MSTPIPLLVVLGVGVLVAPFVIAERAADKVMAGDEYRVMVLPGVVGFTVEQVNVSDPLDVSVVRLACVSHLGSNGSFTIVYDSSTDETWRIPNGQIGDLRSCE